MFNRKIKEERDYAEQRALEHFRKLFLIEMILEDAEKDKTPSVIVVDKIKEVIQPSKQNNF